MTSIRANGTNQADWPSGIYISAGEGRLRLPPGDSERMLKPSIDVTHRGVHGAVQIPERRRLRSRTLARPDMEPKCLLKCDNPKCDDIFQQK
ncbi:hypothetical protein V1477_015000 [Vespula maculifrons]|uniref:Uncharacterized protein n=2 Tax=Vespula TaxID=7451 RepID=A0A834JJ32_VESVU|nr:hypothetical protein HZH66_010127 [Vespula vulgaris]